MDELMGHISNDWLMEFDATCPFHGCLLELVRQISQVPVHLLCKSKGSTPVLTSSGETTAQTPRDETRQRYSKWPKMLRYCNKSAQNLGRMLLSFRSRTCPYFQWLALNASWYKAILDFTLEKLNTPQHHPRYPVLALNHAWWLTNQRKKQNAAPFRDHPYTQSGRSFENKHQAPSAFQRACYTA